MASLYLRPPPPSGYHCPPPPPFPPSQHGREKEEGQWPLSDAPNCWLASNPNFGNNCLWPPTLQGCKG